MIRAVRRSDIVLWGWLAGGVLAFACVPALRARDPFWGWLPFWLLVAPLLDLGLLHRQRLLATSQAFLVRRLRRCRRPAQQQARRLRTRRHVRAERREAKSKHGPSTSALRTYAQDERIFVSP